MRFAIQRWLYRDAAWWQFWYPSSGLTGGAIAAFIVNTLLLLLMSSCAQAECMPSAAAAKAAHPGARWASWSGRQPGHRGEHCWYVPGHKHDGDGDEARHTDAKRREVRRHLSSGAATMMTGAAVRSEDGQKLDPDPEIDAALHEDRLRMTDPAEAARFAEYLIPLKSLGTVGRAFAVGGWH